MSLLRKALEEDDCMDQEVVHLDLDQETTAVEEVEAALESMKNLSIFMGKSISAESMSGITLDTTKVKLAIENMEGGIIAIIIAAILAIVAIITKIGEHFGGKSSSGGSGSTSTASYTSFKKKSEDASDRAYSFTSRSSSSNLATMIQKELKETNREFISSLTDYEVVCASDMSTKSLNCKLMEGFTSSNFLKVIDTGAKTIESVLNDYEKVLKDDSLDEGQKRTAITNIISKAIKKEDAADVDRCLKAADAFIDSMKNSNYNTLRLQLNNSSFISSTSNPVVLANTIEQITRVGSDKIASVGQQFVEVGPHHRDKMVELKESLEKMKNDAISNNEFKAAIGGAITSLAKFLIKSGAAFETNDKKIMAALNFTKKLIKHNITCLKNVKSKVSEDDSAEYSERMRYLTECYDAYKAVGV